jgi:phosphate-selective porin OprO/OprP
MLAALCWQSVSRGQDVAGDLANLRSRIEAVERENAELRNVIGQRLPPLEVDASDPRYTSSPASYGADELRVRTIVEQYLDERETLTAAKAAPASEPEFVEVGKDLSMTGVWRNGLHMETKDKAFRIHLIGRFQFDGVWLDAEENVEFGPNGIGDTLDGVNYRRMRVGAEGTFWEICNFHFEPDFINSFNSLAPNGTTQTTTAPVPIDNYVEVTQLPLFGNVRIGSIKPEYGFEHLTSSNNLDFLERSFLFDAWEGGLDNGFQPGIDIYNTFADQRIRIANCFTKNNQSIFGFNQGDGEYNWVTRLTALPVYEQEGRYLVHIGCSYSHKDLDQGSYRHRARTTLRNGPSALQTTLADVTLTGDSIDMVIPEFVVVRGPWSVVAEYAGVWTNDVTLATRGFGLGATPLPSATVFYDGFHVEALYFLTGEHRPYNRRMAFFDRPIPSENFFLIRGEEGICRGRGAWQVGARYSQVDFNDAGTNGGIVRDVTLGLNWYLNPNLKFQFNQTITEREIPGVASNGFVYGFGTRMALNF